MHAHDVRVVPQGFLGLDNGFSVTIVLISKNVDEVKSNRSELRGKVGQYWNDEESEISKMHGEKEKKARQQEARAKQAADEHEALE